MTFTMWELLNSRRKLKVEWWGEISSDCCDTLNEIIFLSKDETVVVRFNRASVQYEEIGPWMGIHAKISNSNSKILLFV